MMDAVKDYLSSLVIVAAAAGLISSFVPVGENSSMKKYINYAVALAVVIIILSPFKSALGMISSLDEYIILDSEKNKDNYEQEKEKTDKWIIEKSQETIKEGIKNLLYDRFAIQREEAEVSLELDTSNQNSVVIRKIVIKLSGYAMWQNSGEIEQYIASLVKCDCEVING